MRLGILDCDRLDPDLADRFGPVYSEMFIRGFAALAPELEFRVWSALDGELPEDLHECDAWLITGSRHDAYSDIPWIQALRAWIRQAHDADVKLAGVCFGHQVIAQALGGEVVKSTKGWGLGVSVHPMLADEPWMAPARDHIRILASHQDQVALLPPGATRLAGNDFCPNFMFLQGDHIVAIQGHPEFSVEYNRALIERRRGLLPDERYQSSLSSLEGEVDSATMMQWLLQFLGILPLRAGAA
ncbi:glutamine amidotransferase-related protein [Aeromonas veronii]|jgi:GMP synthase-like glutamine amidotransferase|uniref:glutamine amidotransferase-related protein n=1 Tax=Aeromonas TaxID=642 RepID=UPI00143190D8|nr:glutamine amidotransferase [Aeromonas veronii]MCF5895725.1 glutamine amidotransferase [Aeromonas veronii]MEB5669338.1 glutamine amidotransferase [Aeromonas veronii]NJI10256.1 glutamine amidotransferase [Aeromonas veronii]WOE84948.1 glutamine amidotransferase [Aeromonas veronii]WOE85252.1 glutamine amidotransferase [Aeromonas veronii]